jgi:hypothetical protein
LSRRVTRDVKPLPDTDAELSELIIEPAIELLSVQTFPGSGTNDLEIS